MPEKAQLPLTKYPQILMPIKRVTPYLLLVALVGALATFGYLHFDTASECTAQDSTFSRTATEDAATLQRLTPEELANIRVYEVANRCVVNINTLTQRMNRLFMVPVPGQGSGSGSVLDRQGHILTNSHVVEGAREIEVTLASGESFEAEIVGEDAESDIAVLKIDAPADKLFPIQLGRSDTLRVGQQAFVLGNPFGLEGTLTKGVISSLNRSIAGRTGREMKSLIQTDAAMNPGNSGGPLLDSQARMIGMNVAIASSTGQNAGVGFAIPVERIRSIVPELIEHGKISRPAHGIVEVMNTRQGVKVVSVVPGGPADEAGLRGYGMRKETRRQGPIVYEKTVVDQDAADYILAIDGKKVSTHTDLLSIIDGCRPGQKITLTILRDGERMELEMVLGEA
jgi:S1-C subfamily serine protease